MGWLFGRNKGHDEKKPILGGTLPKDDERLGPAPPPPPTKHSAGVTVHRFAAVSGLLAERSASRSGRTLVLRTEGDVRAEERADPALTLSALALSDAHVATDGLESPLRVGDLFFARSGAGMTLRGEGGGAAALLLDAAAGPSAPEPPALIGREELAGKVFPGITGIRALRRTKASLAVRLGPPPGARWVLVGLRSVAVFRGKLVAMEGDEAVEIRAGELGVIAEPTATLYLQAGNDAALAFGFAAPDLVVALG